MSITVVVVCSLLTVGLLAISGVLAAAETAVSYTHLTLPTKA